MTSRRRHLRALALALGALALGGCLGGPDLASPEPTPASDAPATAEATGETAALLAAAAEKASAAGSSKLAMTMSLALPGAPKRVEISMDGAFDLERQRGRLEFDYAGLLEALGPGAEQVSSFLPDVMIFDGSVVYLRMPDLAQAIPDAKPWVLVDSAALAQQQGLDVAGVGQLGQADPTQLLELLEAFDGPIENLGADPVRGQDATHYRAVLDLTKLTSTVPEEQRAALEAQMQQLREFGLDRMPIDVWIDGEGRVTRMSSTLAVPDTGDGGGTIAWDVTLFDFGTPVKIKRPAKKNTESFDQILGALTPVVTG